LSLVPASVYLELDSVEAIEVVFFSFSSFFGASGFLFSSAFLSYLSFSAFSD
jgi:hypothetical protein